MFLLTESTVNISTPLTLSTQSHFHIHIFTPHLSLVHSSDTEDTNPLTEIAFGPDLIPSRDDLTLPSRRPPSENPIRRMSSGNMDEEFRYTGAKEKRKKKFFKTSHQPTVPKYKLSNDKKRFPDTRKELHLSGAIGTDPVRKISQPVSTSNPGFERMESPIVIIVQSKEVNSETPCPGTPKSKSYPMGLYSYQNNNNTFSESEQITPTRANGRDTRITTSDTMLSKSKHKHRFRCNLL